MSGDAVLRWSSPRTSCQMLMVFCYYCTPFPRLFFSFFFFFFQFFSKVAINVVWIFFITT